MPDNFERMTSSEAPKNLQEFCFPNTTKVESHTPGPWTIYNYGGSNQGHYDGYLKTDIRAGEDLINVRQSVVGNTFPKLAANVRLMAASPELYSVLLNLVTAIEAGITTKTLLECSNKENSYLFTAKEVIRKCSTAGK